MDGWISWWIVWNTGEDTVWKRMRCEKNAQEYNKKSNNVSVAYKQRQMNDLHFLLSLPGPLL